MIKHLKSEAGYSLVEVMVAIMILAIAIIPMVSMFDAGLRAAVLGGNFDQGRALADKQLSIAKSKPYAEVRDSWPVGLGAPTTGAVQSGNLSDPDFPGFTYRVTKEYVALEGNSIQPGATALAVKRMMQITVTVEWSGSDYETTGLVARSRS